MIHAEQSPLASSTVTVFIAGGRHVLDMFIIEDWWDRVAGKSWRDCDGNPAALNYAYRAGSNGLPLDDDVLYGKTANGRGLLVHVSEVQA